MERISQYHPNYHKIKEHVVQRFNSEFNNVPLDVVEKYYDNMLFEEIVNPDEVILAKEWWDDLVHETQKEIEEEYNLDEGMYYPDDRTPFFEWLLLCQDHSESIRNHFHESEHYPMWGTVFEAKDNFTSEKIHEYVNELYELGIGVILGKESFNNLLFINGAGYDFYEAHWIPMLLLFGWIPEDLLERDEE